MTELTMDSCHVESYLAAPNRWDDEHGKKCEVLWHCYGEDGEEFVGVLYDDEFTPYFKDVDRPFRSLEMTKYELTDDGLHRIMFTSESAVSALDLYHPWLGASVMYRRGHDGPLPLGAYAPSDHSYKVFPPSAQFAGALYANPVMVTVRLPELGSLIDLARKFRHVANLARCDDDTSEVSGYLLRAIRPMIEELKRPSSVVGGEWYDGNVPLRLSTTGWLLEHQLQQLIDGRHLSTESLVGFGERVVPEVNRLTAHALVYINV